MNLDVCLQSIEKIRKNAQIDHWMFKPHTCVHTLRIFLLCETGCHAVIFFTCHSVGTNLYSWVEMGTFLKGIITKGKVSMTERSIEP